MNQCDHLWHPNRGPFYIGVRCMHCGERRRVCWAWGPKAPKHNFEAYIEAVHRGVITEDDKPGARFYLGRHGV